MKIEVIVVQCYITDLENTINNRIGGYQNVIDIKTNLDYKSGSPWCVIVAKKVDSNKDIERLYTY